MSGPAIDESLLLTLCGKAAARRLSIALAERNGRRMTKRQVMECFGVSPATAKPDLAAVRGLGVELKQ